MNIRKLEGYKEAMELLKQLDKKTADKVVLSLLRKASRPIIKAARRNVKDVSEETAKTIYARKIRKAKMLGVSIKPTTWFAHFVEFGTSGIVGQGKKGYKRDYADNPLFAWVGKVQEGKRYRMDQPAKPFMRPAMDSQRAATNQALVNAFRKDLVEKTIEKYKRKAS